MSLEHRMKETQFRLNLAKPIDQQYTDSSGDNLNNVPCNVHGIRQGGSGGLNVKRNFWILE